MKRVNFHLPRIWSAALDIGMQRRYGGARAGRRLDVMTSFGGDDLDVLQVMLLSLSETHPNDQIEFWFFYLRVGPRKYTELEAFCATLPNINLRPVQVPDRENFLLLSKLGGRPYGARFLWLVAHLHLPQDIDRVVYLDALDTLATGDLVPFLNHPFLGKYVVACRESFFMPPLVTAPARKSHARGASNKWISRVSKGVINSGAMVINLQKMRRDGLGIRDYIDVARWARDEMGLSFGDQGLFSMTHGSHYAAAHDRYNFRFSTEGRRVRPMRPVVIHFAGRIHKPIHLFLAPDQERHLAGMIDPSGPTEIRFGAHFIGVHHFSHYRAWWETCERTPAFARLAPVATANTAKMIAQLEASRASPVDTGAGPGTPPAPG